MKKSTLQHPAPQTTLFSRVKSSRPLWEVLACELEVMPCKQQVRQKSILIDGIFVDVFGADAAERQLDLFFSTRKRHCRTPAGWNAGTLVCRPWLGGAFCLPHHRAPLASCKAWLRWKGKWQIFSAAGPTSSQMLLNLLLGLCYLFARTIFCGPMTWSASQGCCGIEVGCWLDILVLSAGPPRGSRNVLEVLGRVLLIGWTQHRTPRMGFFAAQYAKFKGGHSLPFKNVRLLFPNGEKQPQPCLKGTCHSMSLGSALGSSLAPLILLWWQNVVIFLFQFLWFNFHKPSFGTSGCSPTIIVHGACLEDHSRGRLPCSRSKAGNPWISNGSNSLKTEKPPLFHWKFCPTVAGCFFIQKPLGFHNGVATKCLKTAHQTYLPKVSKGCPFRFCPLSLLAGSLF